MKKLTAASGPTGFGWARSLLAFRHQGPAARLVSTVVAFATATLLVVSSGVAYADDTAPPADPSSTVTDTTTGDTTPSDPATTETSTDSTPSSDPALSGDPAQSTTMDTSTSPTATGPKATAKTTSSTSLKKVSPLASTPPADPDWEWQGTADTLEDGEKDPTAYGSGASEDTNPSTWSQASADTPKADLLKYYFNVDDTSDLIVSFGFTRASTNGDTAFAAEFNQHANSSNTPPRPVRTPGDLLLRFHVDSGNSILVFAHAFVWTSVDDFAAHEADFPQFNGDACEERYNSGFGWCEIPRTGGSFDTRIADDGFTAEATVNLTELFGGSGCLALFRAVNLRGESSSENWTNSLQDYLPLPDASLPSTCATLTIKKFADGTSTPLTGAEYDVWAGTDTTADPLYDNLAEGDAADADTTADDGVIKLINLEPGTYTVKEVTAPDGYLLPAGGTCTDDPGVNTCDTHVVHLSSKEQFTIKFFDPKQWEPLTASKSASGYYDIGWDVAKQVWDGDSWESSATKTSSTSSTDFDYRVVVTEQAASNFRVTGSVTVHNPNDAPVDATLTEVPGVTGATCAFDSGQGVGAGGAITVDPDDDPATPEVEDAGTSYSYTCTFSTPPAAGTAATGSNTAHLEWSQSTYPETQDDVDGTNTDPYELNPSDGYTFAPAADQPTSVTVKDIATVNGNPVHHTFTTTETGGVGTIDSNGDWVLTWTPGGGPYTASYSRTINGSAGQCTAEGANPNTASVYTTGTSTLLDAATTNVVLCVEDGLAVDVSALESLTRTFIWDIAKSTTTPNLNTATGTTAHYGVVITAVRYDDSDWQMSGTATITNPNTFTTKTVSDLDIAYDGDACTLDDPLPTVPVKVGAVDGSATVDFHCTFSSEPSLDGDVTATVKWNSDADSASDPTPQVVTEADWLAGSASVLVDQFIKVFDDHAVPGSADPLFGGTQLKWEDVYASTTPAAHQAAVAYNHTFSGSAIPAAGTCRNLTNTAWFTGDVEGKALGSDTATVRICTPAVIVSPPRPPSHPSVLPNTGGPDGWYLAAGLALLGAGGVLIAGDRRRRHRS